MPSWRPRSRSSTRWQRFAEKTGADVVDLAGPWPADERIPASGSWRLGSGFWWRLPARKTFALSGFPASQLGVGSVASLLDEVDAINMGRRAQTVQLARGGCRRYARRDARVAVLGVAFKPGSDDVRDSWSPEGARLSSANRALSSRLMTPWPSPTRPASVRTSGTRARYRRPRLAPTFSRAPNRVGRLPGHRPEVARHRGGPARHHRRSLRPRSDHLAISWLDIPRPGKAPARTAAGSRPGPLGAPADRALRTLAATAFMYSVLGG